MSPSAISPAQTRKCPALTAQDTRDSWETVPEGEEVHLPLLQANGHTFPSNEGSLSRELILGHAAHRHVWTGSKGLRRSSLSATNQGEPWTGGRARKPPLPVPLLLATPAVSIESSIWASVE
jgi:hypothetical protein